MTGESREEELGLDEDLELDADQTDGVSGGADSMQTSTLSESQQAFNAAAKDPSKYFGSGGLTKKFP